MILSVPSVVCLEWSLSQCKHLLLHFIIVFCRFVSGRHWLLPETYSRNLVLTYNAYHDFEQTFSKACSSVSWPRKCRKGLFRRLQYNVVVGKKAYIAERIVQDS